MIRQAPELYLENQLCFPLYAASRLTTKLYTPFLKELDITYPQYLVMLALWQHEQLTVKEIGEYLFLESNTLTPLLKRLESKGLLKRTRSKSDERTVVISLSKTGESLKKQALLIPGKIAEAIGGSNFNIEELRVFQQNLFKLIDSIDLNVSKECKGIN